MQSRALFYAGLVGMVGLAACSPIRTETMSAHAARRCLNNTVDFGHDGGAVRPEALRAMGVELMIHRATAGGRVDVDYARRERAARAAGLKWGAYHYLKRRMSLEGQLGQFMNAVAAAARRNGTTAYPLMLVLDNEGADRVSWSELARAARMVQMRTGAWPLLYCSVPLRGMATFDQHCRELEALTAADRRVLRACSLWIPRYGEQPGTQVQFSVPRVFGDWTLWQYCGDIGGRPKTAFVAPEFSGNVGAGFTRSGGGSLLRHFCDRDLFNGSHAAFERFCREHASAVLLWR
jgi:GH25 family lysozyme M1 (1,4-beta-N-acetylmuramidase)